MKPELENLTVTQIPTNFVYPDVKDEDFKFGSGDLAGTPLRGDGDWRDYLPPEEDQNIRGIESSACYVEASQHAIATIEEEQFGEADNNYSARFNALLSNGTPTGGNPLQGADSMRTDGLVPDSLMPFGDYINSWSDFHSFKGVIESIVRAKGKEYLGKKILGYDVVCQRSEPVATKYLKLKQALQYSPCPVSVTAWYEKNGIYYKPDGLDDNHLVELVYIDADNHPYIRDTYYPYLKKLDANFNFDFGMRWSVEKKTEEKDWLSAFLDKILALLKSVPSIPTPPPTTSNRDKLHSVALASINTDASPRDLADDELACAESVSNLIKKVYPEFPIFLSTALLKTELMRNPHFKSTLTPSPGCVIISPTGEGNATMPHGHTGIMTDDQFVISNDSSSGLMKKNYTLTSWVNRYRKQGGYHVYLFEPL